MQSETNLSDPEGDHRDNRDISASRPTRRRRWKFLVGVGSVLALMLMVTDFVAGARQKRKEFTSRVHPISGARCRFTLSADWQTGLSPTDDTENDPQIYTFTPPPPSPMQRWIDRYLRHHAKYEPPILYLTRHNAKHLPGDMKIRDGYPEPSLPPFVHVTTHRHLRVDNCSATLMILKESAANSEQGSYLLVYGPDHEFVYVLGSSTTPSEADQTDREFQAVMASFHVEKVAAPPPVPSQLHTK